MQTTNPDAAARFGDSADLAVLAGRRIVICEDEGLTQMQLQRVCARAGLTVVGTALDGLQAVDVVLRERPDIVLMDVQMPQITGLEAARKIRESYREFCLVMLTGNSGDDFVDTVSDLGVFGFVVKPVTSEFLLPRLASAFALFAANARAAEALSIPEAGGADDPTR